MYEKNINLEQYIENLNDDEIKEDIEYILSDLYYLPQAYGGIYCEDIHNIKDGDGKKLI